MLIEICSMLDRQLKKIDEYQQSEMSLLDCDDIKRKQCKEVWSKLLDIQHKFEIEKEINKQKKKL